MTVAVVIGAVSRESPWLIDCLASLDGCGWPVMVNVTVNWELTTIDWASWQYDEFVFLPESTVVLDQAVFDRCFGDYAGRSVSLAWAQGGPFRMYMGKYRSEVVRRAGVPTVRSKYEAIAYEWDWGQRYSAADGAVVNLGAPLEHTDRFVEKHGRTNMVVANEFFERFKAHWGQPCSLPCCTGG